VGPGDEGDGGGDGADAGLVGQSWAHGGDQGSDLGEVGGQHAVGFEDLGGQVGAAHLFQGVAIAVAVEVDGVTDLLVCGPAAELVTQVVVGGEDQ
jgi:hypothetical protein